MTAVELAFTWLVGKQLSLELISESIELKRQLIRLARKADPQRKRSYPLTCSIRWFYVSELYHSNWGFAWYFILGQVEDRQYSKKWGKHFWKHTITKSLWRWSNFSLLPRPLGIFSRNSNLSPVGWLTSTSNEINQLVLIQSFYELKAARSKDMYFWMIPLSANTTCGNCTLVTRLTVLSIHLAEWTTKKFHFSNGWQMRFFVTIQTPSSHEYAECWAHLS